MTNKERNPEARALLEKIVVNAGVGKASSSQPNFEEKVLTQIARDIAVISGQKPEIRRARRSIAGFKVREGQVVGLRITLRRRKMVDFLERLIRIVLPRVRDFAGVDPEAVDKGGVLNLGFREQFVFPEIDPEQSNFVFSLGVNLVPKRRNQAGALAAYEKLGIPFRKTAPAKGKKK